MVQVYNKPELEEMVEQEEIFIIIPEKIDIVEKREEFKPQKKLKLFKKHKKPIGINNVKSNLDAKLYINRFGIR